MWLIIPISKTIYKVFCLFLNDSFKNLLLKNFEKKDPIGNESYEV